MSPCAGNMPEELKYECGSPEEIRMSYKNSDI